MRVDWASVPLPCESHRIPSMRRPDPVAPVRRSRRGRGRSRKLSRPSSSCSLNQSCTHLLDCMRSVCRLTDALLAHTDRVHGRNLGPHSRIFFVPVCLFEIVFICLSHNTSGIDGSRNLSIKGLNLKRIFACSYTYSELTNDESELPIVLPILPWLLLFRLNR